MMIRSVVENRYAMRVMNGRSGLNEMIRHLGIGACSLSNSFQAKVHSIRSIWIMHLHYTDHSSSLFFCGDLSKALCVLGLCDLGTNHTLSLQNLDVFRSQIWLSTSYLLMVNSPTALSPIQKIIWTSNLKALV